MGADTSLVRARWHQSEQGEQGEQSECAEWGAELVRVIAHGPCIPQQVEVDLQRTPADHALSPDHRPEPRPAFDDEHLVAGPDETRWPWLSVADVIIRRADTMSRSLTGMYARYPGCLIVATFDDHECVAGIADGGLARLRPLPPGLDAVDPLYVSVLHAWLVAGRPLASLNAADLVARPVPGQARYGAVRVGVSRSWLESARSAA